MLGPGRFAKASYRLREGVDPIGAVVNKLDRERVGRYYSAYRYDRSYDSYYNVGDDDGEDHDDGASMGGARVPAARRSRRGGLVGRVIDGVTSLLS